MDFMDEVKNSLTTAINELIMEADLKENNILVLGCSSSEIVGGRIGKNSSAEVGQLVVKTILELLHDKKIFLAVQGCEHINRALIVEREVALKHNFEIVNVKPALHAGGACSVAAFENFKDPVAIEHIVANASIDIGDTSTGMHVKFVQVPLRLSIDKIGKAHVTYLKSRPKLIGGSRAEYII